MDRLTSSYDLAVLVKMFYKPRILQPYNLPFRQHYCQCCCSRKLKSITSDQSDLRIQKSCGINSIELLSAKSAKMS